MSHLNDYENQVKRLYKQQIFIGKSGSYKKAWLEITRDHAIAIAKLRIYTSDANLQGAQVLRRAMRYDLSEVVLLLSIKLARYHTFEGQWKQVDKYQKITSKYKEVVNAEILAESFVININKDIIKKISSVVLLNKLETYINELEDKYSGVNSYSFILFLNELKIKKYQLKQNQDMILETCKTALSILENKKFTLPKVVTVLFSAPLIPIYIERKELELARHAITICYQNSKYKTNNWYVAHSYDVILCFYEGRFEDVTILLQKVKKYPTDIVRERYVLYKAYSALMGEERFKVRRFINDIPEFSKDKNGYNIAVIIVQLLHLLKGKYYDEYIDRLEATNQYIKRAINAKRVLRSKYFLKILLLLPSANFHPVLFAAKSKQYLKKLKKLPISQSSPSIEIELIPYDILYNRIIELLD